MNGSKELSADVKICKPLASDIAKREKIYQRKT
jgi:hypothetical protein